MFLFLFLFILLSFLLILSFQNTNPSNSNSSLNINQEFNCINISNENKRNSCIIKYSTCTEDSCLYNKAVSFNDVDSCMKINDSDLRITCNHVVSHNSIFQNSVLKNNISLCKTLQDNLTIDACLNNYYSVQAYNLGNKSLCDKISKEAFKNACKLQ